MEPLFQALLLMVCGALLCIVSQAMFCHLFLRIYAYLRDGVDYDKWQSRASRGSRIWKGE